MPEVRATFLTIAFGAIVGILGGAACMALGHASLATGPGLGILYGAAFGFLFARRSHNLGAGMMWSLGYVFLLWLLLPDDLLPRLGHGGSRMPMLLLARAHFADLVAYVFCYALPLGLFFGIRSGLQRRGARPQDDRTRALLVGVMAGIAGGWAFGKWMAQVNYFPVVAGLVHSHSRGVGVTLHFIIAATIGAVFGLVIGNNIRSFGSAIGWGSGYGILWWFIGPLTLVPLLHGSSPDWSHARAAALFGSLVGHIVYGAIVGLVYATIDRIWVGFFTDSDPINRKPEGVGSLALHSLHWGILASISGGLLFSVIMLATGVLPKVAHLVGGASVWVGFLTHMTISAILGVTYGILFRREATHFGNGLAWGLLYGQLWWFIGPLTLEPILLGGSSTWTTAAASAALPALIGHLLYGAAMASVFVFLERRHDRWLALDPRISENELRPHRATATAAPALWVIVLGAGAILPIILA